MVETKIQGIFSLIGASSFARPISTRVAAREEYESNYQQKTQSLRDLSPLGQYGLFCFSISVAYLFFRNNEEQN